MVTRYEAAGSTATPLIFMFETWLPAVADVLQS